MARTKMSGWLAVAVVMAVGGLSAAEARADVDWLCKPGQDVLHISSIGDARTLNPAPEPGWGTHIVDVNIGLGNLLRVLNLQARGYAAD